MTTEEKLAAYEAMHKAVQADHDRTIAKMAQLKQQGEQKTKTATYRQLMGNKLTTGNILAMYRLYGVPELPNLDLR